MNTFPFTQFYHINYDMQRPYMMCGGLQDNGNWCGPSQALSAQGIRKNDWYTVSGGDGFFTVPVMDKPWLVYSDAQGGMLNITDTRTGTQKTIYPYPNRVGSVGDAMISHKYRFNWNSPIALSPMNPKVVYFGGNVLFKSTDYGMSWKVISPDLTTNDPKKQESSGGPIVVDNTAAEFHCTILTIAPSPIDSNVVWVGTDDGNVQVTRDGGKTWSNVFTNVTGLKPNAWIPTVEASHYDVGTAYVAADHHQDDDYTPYAYMTTDFGKTWKRITGDLPASAAWTHVVREDPRNRNLLYIGTEMGVWASWDNGVHWMSIRGDVPPTPSPRHSGASARERPSARDARPRSLHHGRHLGAAEPRRRRVGRRDAVRHSARDALGALEPRRKPRPEEVDGRQSAARRAHYVLPQVAAGGRSEHHDHRQRRAHGAAHAPRVRRRGHQSRRMGPSHGRTGGHRRRRTRWSWRRRGCAAGRGCRHVTRRVPRTSRGCAERARPGRRWRGRTGRGGGGGLDVLPGTYTVALSVNGKQLTKPVQVQIDPRSDMTAHSS